MAKALGYSTGQQDAWSKQIDTWGVDRPSGDDHDIPQPVVDLADQLLKAPRHLGIHSGGMVLTERPVGEVCPIERGRMDDRTVLQWDKDSCAWMGLVKFDFLGLGILARSSTPSTWSRTGSGSAGRWTRCPRRSRGLRHALPGRLDRGLPGREPGPDRHPAPAAAAPVLRPGDRDRADPARPDPGRGGAPLHPPGDRPGGGHLPAPGPRAGAGADHGRAAVPGAADADRHDRRRLHRRRRRPAAPGDGVQARGGEDRAAPATSCTPGWPQHGITGELADDIYARIQAFANFGFAESHAISFALLVYASSWLKLHYPGAFLAGLLRAQPMGFYSPQSLVADARRHGVEVRRPDIAASPAVRRRPRAAAATRATGPAPDDRDWTAAWPLTSRRSARSTATRPDPTARAPPRRRLRRPAGADRGAGDRRASWPSGSSPSASARPFADHERRGPPDRADRRADRGAGHGRRVRRLRASAGGRRCGTPATPTAPTPCPARPSTPPPPMLPGMSAVELTLADLWATKISPDDHPISHLRPVLDEHGIVADRRPRRRRTPSAGSGRRAGHPPAAAGHRGRGHLPQPRGRDRDAQRGLLAGAVAALPPGRPQRRGHDHPRACRAQRRGDQPGRRPARADQHGLPRATPR